MTEFLIKTTIDHYLLLGHLSERDRINELQLPQCIRDLVIDYVKYNIDDFKPIYGEIYGSVYSDEPLSNPKLFLHMELDLDQIPRGKVRFCESYISKYSEKLCDLPNIDFGFDIYCNMIRSRDVSNVIEPLMPSDATLAELDIDPSDVRNAIIRCLIDFI